MWYPLSCQVDNNELHDVDGENTIQLVIKFMTCSVKIQMKCCIQ